MGTNELYHYGVKGMRWGVRRAQRKIDRKADRKGWSDDVRNVAKIKTKKVDQMSNRELQQLNERTRLEQERSRLNPTRRKRAVQYAAATVATMGTMIALYEKSGTIVTIGKKAVGGLTKVMGKVLSEL